MVFEGDSAVLNSKQLDLIADVIKKEGLEDAKVTIKSFSQTGDNYVASVKRIIAEKDGRTLKMVAKIAPTEERSALSIKMHTLFYREYLMYSRVLPMFTAMEEAAKIPASERLRYAKFYGALTEEPLEFILLEDLQVPGFTMLDKTKPLPNEAVKLVLKSLAKLHACSYALKNQEPETFKEWREPLGDSWLEVANDKNTLQFFDSYVEDANAILSSDKHKAVLKKYVGKRLEISRDIHNTDYESRYSVIQQGDCWANNILFRVEGTTPKECCMIDYQLGRVNNPASDLLYMIFSCANYQSLSKHFHEWIDYYYSELDKHLNKLGLKSDYWLPRDQLDAGLKRHLPLALHNAIFFASLLSRESAEIGNMIDALTKIKVGGVDFEKALIRNSLTNASEKIKTNFRTRLTILIDSLLELGYI